MSFKRELDLAISQVKEITTQDWRRSINDAFLSAVLKTPVDKGQAVNSWYVSLAGVNDGKMPRNDDRSGSGSISDVQSKTNNAELGDVVMLYSNAPHIERLEDGYSLQAPVGMVKGVVADWPQIVARNTRG